MGVMKGEGEVFASPEATRANFALVWVHPRNRLKFAVLNPPPTIV